MRKIKKRIVYLIHKIILEKNRSIHLKGHPHHYHIAMGSELHRIEWRDVCTYVPLKGEGEGEDDDGGSGAGDDDDEEGRDAGGEQGAEEHHVEAVDALHGEEATYGDHVGARHGHRRHAVAAAQHPSSS